MKSIQFLNAIKKQENIFRVNIEKLENTIQVKENSFKYFPFNLKNKSIIAVI